MLELLADKRFRRKRSAPLVFMTAMSNDAAERKACRTVGWVVTRSSLRTQLPLHTVSNRLVHVEPSTEYELSTMRFRFVVGVPGVSQSSSWKLWTQGNETYMLTRQTGGNHKFSFHSSGICRWALTRESTNGAIGQC